jgi:hypothetical protein
MENFENNLDLKNSRLLAVYGEKLFNKQKELSVLILGLRGVK